MIPKLPRQTSSTRYSKNHAENPDEAHTYWRWILGAVVLGTLPQLLFKIGTARRDLAVRRQTFPAFPALQDEDRLLVFAPHPDDETLGCGGLLAQAKARNLAVRVVFLTDGDGSGSTRIGETWRQKKRPTYQEIARLRQSEATNALQQLGVARDEIVFPGFPDGGLMALWREHWRPENAFRSPFTKRNRVSNSDSPDADALFCGQNLLRAVLRQIEDFRPTRVFTTDGNDTHADHRAAFCFALAALGTWKIETSQAISQAENIESSTRFDDAQLWTYLVHHAIWPLPHGEHRDNVLAPPASLARIGAAWKSAPVSPQNSRDKRAALSCYESQLTWTPHYLRSFLRRNELFCQTPRSVSHVAQASRPNFLEATELLRDSMKNSLTQQLFPSVDLWGLRFQSPAPKGTVCLQIGTRSPASSRCGYSLQIHVLNRDIAQTRAWKIEVSGKNEKWKALCQTPDGTVQKLRVSASLDGLEIDVPRALLYSNGATTWLVSARSHCANRMLDATSTVALKLDALDSNENQNA